MFFANDTNILNRKINRTMKDLQTWFHANGVVINTEKTVAMSFRARQNKSFLKPDIHGVLI